MATRISNRPTLAANRQLPVSSLARASTSVGVKGTPPPRVPFNVDASTYKVQAGDNLTGLTRTALEQYLGRHLTRSTFRDLFGSPGAANAGADPSKQPWKSNPYATQAWARANELTQAGARYAGKDPVWVLMNSDEKVFKDGTATLKSTFLDCYVKPYLKLHPELAATTQQQLVRLNGIKDPNKILIGQSLTLPAPSFYERIFSSSYQAPVPQTGPGRD